MHQLFFNTIGLRQGVCPQGKVFKSLCKNLYKCWNYALQMVE